MTIILRSHIFKSCFLTPHSSKYDIPLTHLDSLGDPTLSAYFKKNKGDKKITIIYELRSRIHLCS
jgi:hypothetical protein